MDWQLAAAGLGVVAAVAYIGRRAWRTWGRTASGCGGCGSGCKSESAPTPTSQVRFIPLNQLAVRRRRDD